MFSGLQNLSMSIDEFIITMAIVVAVSVVLIVVGAVLKAIAEEKKRPKKKIYNVLIAVGFVLMSSVGLIYFTLLCVAS